VARRLAIASTAVLIGLVVVAVLQALLGTR
jgi:hypothetical protein